MSCLSFTANVEEEISASLALNYVFTYIYLLLCTFSNHVGLSSPLNLNLSFFDIIYCPSYLLLKQKLNKVLVLLLFTKYFTFHGRNICSLPWNQEWPQRKAFVLQTRLDWWYTRRYQVCNSCNAHPFITNRILCCCLKILILRLQLQNFGTKAWVVVVVVIWGAITTSRQHCFWSMNNVQFLPTLLLINICHLKL